MKNITKIVKTASLGALLFLYGFSAKAQTFSQTAPYETIVIQHDTLYWDITTPTLTGGEWGSVSVTVYYQGDFGGGTELMTIYGENYTELGVTHAYYDGSDCQPDSVTLTFPTSMLSSWGADNVLHFYGITTDFVDFFCSTNEAAIKVDYNYCPLGGPVALLQTPATSSFCAPDPGLSLVGTPSGGTFSGDGVSGASFDPSGLSTGSHTIVYSYQNVDGCTSLSDAVIEIKPGATASADTYDIYPMQTVNLYAAGNGHLQWFSDAAVTNNIGTDDTLTINVPATTTYYTATTLQDTYFKLDTLTPQNPVLIDMVGEAGNNRAGIAVTTDYIYMTGNSYTARYDLDLQNGVSLPIMDELFSDLSTGQLYTLYSSYDGLPDPAFTTYSEITEIRSLNDDLSLGSTVIPLSQNIFFGHSYSSHESGLFSGYGFVIIYSAVDITWYAIDLQDGIVTNLGTLDPDFVQAKYAANWAWWGIAEFTENGYAVLYRDDYSSNILRRVLPDQTPTIAAEFSDLSDLANFTYAPWNGRWYFHFSGGGSQFSSPYQEALMYADASDSTGGMTYAGTLGCPAEVSIHVSSPLPLELVSFTSEIEGNIVQCNWVTASERDLDFFTVERSTEGFSFLPIGTVKATGNSEQTQAYSLTDQNPAQGINYYRLKIIDVDGTTTYSDVISHKFGLGIASSIYPNPASESIYVDLGDVSKTATGFLIYDALGRLMFTQKSDGTALQKLDISSLGNGTYMLHFEGSLATHILFTVAK